MNRKRALIVVAALGALLFAATLALPYLVDVNKYRGLIQAKAEQSLGRKVTLGTMSLSLLPTFGIRVNDLEVQDLMRARRLTVGVRLLPLVFGGAVDVRKVILDQPEITVARDHAGKWSFDGIGSAPGGQAEQSSQPPRAFSLATLQINDGRLHMQDAMNRTGAPLALDFELTLHCSVKGSGAGDLDAAFDGKLAGDRLALDLRGTFQRAEPPGPASFDITVDQAEVGLARARELAASFGKAWPLPEGLLAGDQLKLGGRVAGRTESGALASLDVTDLVWQDADIRLSRDRSGHWNYEPLFAGGDGATPAQGRQAGPVVTLRNLRLGGAHVRLHDEAPESSPVDLELGDALLVIQEYAVDRPLDMQFSADVKPGGGSMEVAGKVPLSAGAVLDVTVDLKQLDAHALAPYLRQVTDLDPSTGTVSAHATLKGSWPRQVRAAGWLSLEAVKTGATSPITAKADFDLDSVEAASKVRIDRFDVAFGRSRLGITGNLSRDERSTVVDLALPAASMDAADLVSLAALAGVKSPIEFSSGQPVKLEARIRGDIVNRKNLELSGGMEVSDFSFRLPVMSKPMEQVKGRVTLRKDGFDVSGFSGVIGRSDIAGTMSVDDLSAPRARFALTSRRADFWELMSFLKDEGETPGAPGASAGGADDDLLSRVTALGKLSIAQGSFDTLAFSDMDTTLTLEKKVLRLDPVSMKLYGGAVTGSASMDMARSPAVYSVSAKPSGIDTDALLEANLQMKGMLAGALSGQLTVASSGATRDAALRNARGSGDVRIEKGRVGAVNVLKVLSRASDLLGERSLKEVSSRLAKEGTEFSQLDARLEVGSGRIRARNLNMMSPDLELKDDGSLDMLGGTIDIAGQIVFSETISQAMVQERSKAVDYFWDTRLGRVNLPLTMSGPVASPTPNIDWSSAGGKLARRKTEESLRDRLKDTPLSGLLGNRGGASREPSPPSEPKAPRAPASAELGINVEEKGFSGNPLLPDLKVKGVLNGTGITGATVRVTDEKGRVLQEESLGQKVSKYYATRDRTAPAAINFRVEVDAKRLLGAKGPILVAITVSDEAGGTVTKNVEVSR